jgi:hypothetical protein
MAARIEILQGLTDILHELATENTYVIANSIPVVKWSDASTDLTGIYVLVQVDNSRQLFGDSDCYEVICSYRVRSYQADDEDRSSSTALYEEISALLVNMTPAQCNGTDVASGTGLTIDGIIEREQGDGQQENYWEQPIQATFYMQVATTT